MVAYHQDEKTKRGIHSRPAFHINIIDDISSTPQPQKSPTKRDKSPLLKLNKSVPSTSRDSAADTSQSRKRKTMNSNKNEEILNILDSDSSSPEIEVDPLFSTPESKKMKREEGDEMVTRRKSNSTRKQKSLIDTEDDDSADDQKKKKQKELVLPVQVKRRGPGRPPGSKGKKGGKGGKQQLPFNSGIDSILPDYLLEEEDQDKKKKSNKEKKKCEESESNTSAVGSPTSVNDLLEESPQKLPENNDKKGEKQKEENLNEEKDNIEEGNGQVSKFIFFKIIFEFLQK